MKPKKTKELTYSDIIRIMNWATLIPKITETDKRVIKKLDEKLRHYGRRIVWNKLNLKN